MGERTVYHHLLDTTDAMEWATEFCKQFDGRRVESAAVPHPGGHSSMPVLDEGTMVGWFANAIEIGRMHPDFNTLLRFLVGDRWSLYTTNAEFHAVVHSMMQIIPYVVRYAAESCKRAADEREVATDLLTTKPFDVNYMREQIRKMDDEGLQ